MKQNSQNQPGSSASSDEDRQDEKRANPPRGRGRGEMKTRLETKKEDQAKGHNHDAHPKQPAMDGVPHDIVDIERDRGHQKGYGKNQQDEGILKKGAHSSKSNGAELAEGNAKGFAGNQQMK